jgi:predicted aspartyl protease
MVTNYEKPEVKSLYDLNYLSDDGSAVMVQASNNNKQVNGITVVEVPGKEGTRHATTILIDNGFTGYAIMSHQFAKDLGYEFQCGKGELYRTTTGNMKTMFSVTVTNV